MGRPRKVRPEEEEVSFDCYPVVDQYDSEPEPEPVRSVPAGLQYINIRLPIAPLRENVHIPAQVNLKMRGPMGRTFRRLLDGLVQDGAATPRGNKVSMSAPDVFAHILAQVQDKTNPE